MNNYIALWQDMEGKMVQSLFLILYECVRYICVQTVDEKYYYECLLYFKNNFYSANVNVLNKSPIPHFSEF